MKRALALFGWCVVLFGFAHARPLPVTEGSLVSLDSKGQESGLCPLKHTSVKADISGFLARVTVQQQFYNPRQEKIEAVYVFPLPQDSAVDDMTMTVGGRVVRGVIKRREEARAIYEAARANGHVAGLLDQERPNIFTQSVANIMPGASVDITISYVETLKYEEGAYEFVFPMVVGPRYIPGNPVGAQGGGWAPDTDRVPDASRITPHVAPKGTRAGHDISLELTIDAGVPIDALKSPTHEVDIARINPHQATVTLKQKAVIPNKDFILRYDVAGRRINDAVLAYNAGKGGFFTLILQPPERLTVPDVTPKELVFVLDTSGSMQGFPIEKAKETMRLALDGLYPQDSFNLITFSGDTRILFPEPVPATPENVARAKAFINGQGGAGGTEMMKAIRAALDPSDRQDHVRIVCFMTDGYVGNDLEIIAEVQRHPNARVFAFGVGSSVNRFLLDNMARYGRGEVEYVGLNDDGDAAARRFHERVRNPLLTDISIDWNGLPVADVYPQRIPDLFGAKPVILSGRYMVPARGIIRIRGKMSGRAFTRDVALVLPASEPAHDVLATLWARRRIDDLAAQDYLGMQQGRPRTDLKEAITQLGLDFRLMTPFTSFVAVEERIVTDGGQPRRVEVPVEMPEGVTHEGVFGEGRQFDSGTLMAFVKAKRVGVAGGAPGGVPAGQAGGVIGGIIGAAPVAAPPPPPPPLRREMATVPRSKLDPALLRLMDQRAPAQDRKVEIRVWLATDSNAVLERIKRLGFETVLWTKASKLLVGRIPVSKLRELAAIPEVRYIAAVDPASRK